MASSQRLYNDHPRVWRDFSYVYPVLSRRSRGLSIGINLNVDKVCNFHCVYCQVDRTVPPPRQDVDLDQIRTELDWMCGWAAGGAIWQDDHFATAPADCRRINDIAFSGDGEPTGYAHFDKAVQTAVEVKQAHGLDEVKLVLLTNASLLHRPRVAKALEVLDAHQGEVWAKLDAGTQAYYDLVDRSRVPLDRILANIAAAGQARSIVVQSLFMSLHGQPTPAREFEAYCDRLGALLDEGCQIRLVQLYTVARRPAESYVQALPIEQLQAMAATLQSACPTFRAKCMAGEEPIPDPTDNSEGLQTRARASSPHSICAICEICGCFPVPPRIEKPPEPNAKREGMITVV
jgi:wyosine [tRNA(Phe)-imidazoG37] synthetase (radical SAM superfamily)